MNTKFLFSIRIPEEFNLQKFETQFVNEFKKYGMNVYELKKDNSNGDYEFETDYNFNVKDSFENYINEQIYDEINFFKNRYNEKNKPKLEVINLTNYNTKNVK